MLSGEIALRNNHYYYYYIMLYTMLAYLMSFSALSNAVCLYNAFFAIDFGKCFLFSCFVLVY